MLPDAFIKRLKTQDYLEPEKLITALNEPGPVSVRINPAKWSRVPTAAERVPWCENGYYIKERPSYTSDPLFHAGCYYPQEASSMFLEEIYNQLLTDESDLKVLDLCGAPGGKSTHLSSLIGNKGFIVSNEVIRQRASVLSENITKWGLPNCIVTNSDPSVFGRLGGYFDLIVADAPCSGEGMFRDNLARSEWSEANTSLCSERQQRILIDSWPALKTGGLLVYSTCTFNPAENEQNVKWLCENTDSESVRIDISRFPGVLEIEYKNITGYAFHPGSIDGDGFFISVIRKKGSENHHVRNSGKKTSSISSENVRTANRLVEDSSGYLYRYKDIVYRLSILPEEFKFLAGQLRIINGGTGIFRERNRDITPLHDLALSTLLKNGVFPETVIDYEQSLLYLCRENLGMRSENKGWMLVSFRGVNLGFIKNLGNRINNYYPAEWRIRMKVGNEQKSRIINWSD